MAPVINYLVKRHQLNVDTYDVPTYSGENVLFVTHLEYDLNYKWRDFWAPEVENPITLGFPTPNLWFLVLDEYFETLIGRNINFEIQNFRVVNDELIGYLKTTNEHIQQLTIELQELQTILKDKRVAVPLETPKVPKIKFLKVIL